MSIEVISEITAKNNADFALIDDNNLRGGYQVVTSLEDMNNIPDDKRKAGMQVRCTDSSISYTLQADLVTWLPTVVPSAPTPTYVHTQIISSAIWNINHALNKYPSVVVVDSAGREVQGDTKYVDVNNVIASFSGPFSGQAFLN